MDEGSPEDRHGTLMVGSALTRAAKVGIDIENCGEEFGTISKEGKKEGVLGEKGNLQEGQT